MRWCWPCSKRCGDGSRRTGRTWSGASGSGAAAFLCPRSRAAELADFLLAKGARRVMVQSVEQVFETENLLYNALASKVFAAG